jgi:lipoprotein-anchoring transpeptidase ErfK/SrfK
MQAIRILAVLVAASAEVFAEGGGVRRIVVSLADRKIALFEDGQVVKVYPIAVGKHSTPSPNGSFHIASRVVRPTWYQPGKVVPASRRRRVTRSGSSPKESGKTFDATSRFNLVSLAR